jgi:dTDP-4-dehydrorhamnose 3,5-epimerase
MEVLETSLEGVLLLKPRVFRDERGFFLETFNRRIFQEHGLPEDFLQDNASRSSGNVVRGIHLQSPHAQGKLIRVARGRVFDVVVDLRPGSSTFGAWIGVTLDDENCHQLWIPPGFGHGFATLTESVDFMYKCTEFYHPECEVCVRWDDPDLAIRWPEGIEPVMSEKDAQGMSFKEYCSRRG